MSQPPPDWSEEELLLLRSAQDDRPAAGSLAATLAALGVGAAVGAASTTAAAAATSTGAGASAAKWGSAVAISKWVSIVAIGGAVATGVVYERRATAPTSPQAGAVARTKQARVAAAPLHAVEQPALAQPALPEASASPAMEVVTASSSALRPARPTASKRKEPEPAAAQPDLSREIATIDEARSALQRGSAIAALQALDRYDTELAQSGSLQHEAAALRIEALFRLHDRRRAESLAQAFLVKHPSSPYAARIRELISADSAAKRR